MHGQHNIKNI